LLVGKTNSLRFVVSFHSPDHDNTNNVMALAFGVVVVGSLLMPAAELMNLQMQH